MKATLSEVMRKPQGTNSEGKESGAQINNLEHKEETSSQLEENEGTRIQKKKKKQAENK